MAQQTNSAYSQKQQQQQQWMAMHYPYYYQMIPHQFFTPQSFIHYPSIIHHQQQSHQGSSSEQNRTIWVGNLHYWMEENYIHSWFAHTGEVASIKVIRNKQTRESKGYGFVEFYTRAAAEKVLQTYNASAMLNGEQPFRLNWASFRMGDRRYSDGSIFVGDLASDVTDTLLNETFATRYSSVIGAKVVIDANTGRSKGYGFVRFGNDNEKTQAIKEMNGVYCSSRQMRVGVATPRKSTQVSSMKGTWTKLERSLQTPVFFVLDGGKEETTSNLPDDLIVHILSFLPVKSILRFRCVCKYWCKLFDDPKFIKTHLTNSVESNKFNSISIKGQDNEFSMLIRNSSSLTTFEGDYFEAINLMDLPFIKSPRAIYPYQSTFIHGSCNGLILMENNDAKGHNINICLWNPTTKEYKVMEEDYTYKPSFNKYLMPDDYEYGLGYDCDADDYKIVKANPVYYDDSSDYYELDCCGYEFQVYTLSLDSWKRIHNIFPYKIDFYHDAFVNGALHWIATPCSSSTDQKHSWFIVSFDIRGETLEEVPFTPQVDELIVDDMTSLGVLEGCLCIVFSGSCNTEVWVMKDHKVTDSWTRLFVARIPVDKSVKDCCMTIKREFKNGKVLFEAWSGEDAYFVIYDYKAEVSKIFRIPEWRSSIETYVESLVPISGTYAGKQEFPTLQKHSVTEHHLNGEIRRNRVNKIMKRYHLEEKICILGSEKTNVAYRPS